MSGQQHIPAALYPQERPGTHCTGGWVCPRAGLDGRKISAHRDSIPGPSSLLSVAIPTELHGPRSQPIRYLKAQGGGVYMHSIVSTSALDGGTWSMSSFSCFGPGKESRYPLMWRLGGCQGWSGCVLSWENTLQLGFEMWFEKRHCYYCYRFQPSQCEWFPLLLYHKMRNQQVTSGWLVSPGAQHPLLRSVRWRQRERHAWTKMPRIIALHLARALKCSNELCPP